MSIATRDRSALLDYYIFIVNDGENFNGLRINAKIVAQRRLSKLCWPLYSGTPHRFSIKKNDTCLIYLAGKGEDSQHFYTIGVVKNVVDFTNEYQDIDGENTISAQPTSIVLFEHLISLDSPIPIKSILDKLSFIPNNRIKWGAVMQTGCRKITENDFKYIIKK